MGCSSADREHALGPGLSLKHHIVGLQVYNQ